jgi:hypothetical protein
MAKAKKFKITEEQILKMERAKRRQEDIEARPLGGFVANHKVFKSKKNYTRKTKHKRVCL